MPAISLPLIQSSNKLPMGIQLVGEKFDDSRFLQTSNWVFKNFKQKK